MVPGRAKSSTEERYELIEKIGEGGMGVVWKAQDRKLSAYVALKTLLDIFDDADFRRFKDECQKLIDLPYHPNIIRIMDIGEFEQGGQWKPFFTMPLLSGATLAERLEKSSDQLTVDRVVEIASQVCRGLQLAHEHSVIHRDIKPSNIFVLNDFSVQIIDFGVAHRTNVSTRTVGRKGTLYYMSPEQVEAKPLSAASDIFSLGVVCYEVLSGRRPFEGTEEGEIVESIRSHQPPALHEFPRDISVPISQAIHKAMAKKPSDRYISAAEFAEVLQKAFHMKAGELFPLPRPRLQLATNAFQKGDYQFARDLVDTLLAEGVSHPEITELHKSVSAAIKLQKAARGIDAARSLMEAGEYLQALKKIRKVVADDPNNSDARALEKQIESRRTDADVEEWLKLARQHMDNFAFDQARQALDRVRKQRPKEPRATLLLTDVLRLEVEYVNLQKEKQRHFDAVQSALQRKDISSASSHAERLWDLEQKRPEAPDANRTAYQNICQQVRSQRESIDAAVQEASRLVEAGKLNAALAICLERLESYPTHEHLLSLRFKIEELQQQTLSARMAEVDRSVHSEPDLNKRVKVLEDALADYPGESHFDRALQQAQNLRQIVDNIVAKAKALEDRKEFAEAHQEWLKLKTVYPRFPSLSVELDRVARLRAEHEKRQARALFVQEIDRQIEGGNFHAALDLIRERKTEYKDDGEISALERIATQGTHSQEEAVQYAAEGRKLWHDGLINEGVLRLRKAYQCDRNNPDIIAGLLEILTERARLELDENRTESAESNLHEALEIDPDYIPAQELLQIIVDRRQERFADECIAAALDLQAKGDLKGAAAHLDAGLRDCPGNERMLQRRASIRRQEDDERGKDRDSLKRLIREAEAINDPKTLKQYSGRLQRISQRYPGDPELQEEIAPFYRRLQTFIEPAPTAQPPAQPTSQPAVAAGMVEEKRPPAEPASGPAGTVPAKPASSRRSLSGPLLGMAKELWAPIGRGARSLQSLTKRTVRDGARGAHASIAPATPSPPTAPAGPLRTSFARWSRTTVENTRIQKSYLLAALVGLVVLVGVPWAAISSWKTARPTPAPAKVELVSFHVSVKPANAEILIDSQHVGKTAAALKLPPGSHLLTARLPGYQTLEKTISVTMGLSLRPIELVPIPLTIRVLGLPNQSSASLDQGQTPVSAVNGEILFQGIAPGRHVLKTTVYGATANAEFDFSPGSPPSVTATAAGWGALLVLSSFNGAQSLTCKCANAKVAIDGQGAQEIVSGGLELTLRNGLHKFAITGPFSGAPELELDDSPALFATVLTPLAERTSEEAYLKNVSDLFHQFRYPEALQAARAWLHDYPDSQAAKVWVDKLEKAE